MELSKTSLNSTEEYQSQHFTPTPGRVFCYSNDNDHTRTAEAVRERFYLLRDAQQQKLQQTFSWLKEFIWAVSPAGAI